MTLSVGQLYLQVRDRFRAAGLPTADLDAKILVSTVLGTSVSGLVLSEDTEVEDNSCRDIGIKTELRISGMPVGRILGERDFYGRRFLLNKATLEPRPDTEILIDTVLARTPHDKVSTIWDIGTGSGAIAVTLLAELPFSQMIAIDLSEEALGCAQKNAQLHQVGDRFHPLCADYLSAFRPDLATGPDWIVSNPPYIRKDVLGELDPEVVRHDPVLALDGGESGLDAYVAIVGDAAHLLQTGGQIALEIGYDQGPAVEKQLRHHAFGAIEIIKDLSGNDRVVTARRL
ncbi:peptide chain release factor N(5)-glutamine methyltransferase [uncultured Roseibium sp.]|uniref:peptide chain release factor N(5)-glutamine methyltransferase n=1 Tax=uncultured Roseibium sp. TaxID=1936171 RepID=UPI0026279216|nr:peptide chain release factor N(5)-glutamine methyltransferase [uncultured Roseibium sp.]